MSDTSEFEIHPLYARDKFPSDIKYNRAFYDASVLATRIMDSPQALQHDFCFFFGTNTSVKLPRRIRPIWPPGTRPMEYACNKGVYELDERALKPFKQRGSNCPSESATKSAAPVKTVERLSVYL